ncbi:hypothetical protein [Pyruvatibacter sp.]|uniref:hypothetical protein n=1 Tax=Pyruvatibacter sp. TaxID=1981328 RepID=UPI0032645F02
MHLRTLGLAALAAVLAMLCVLLLAFWRAAMPDEPDWRGAVDAALASDDCVEAASVLAAAISTDVADGFYRFDEVFLADAGPCGADDLARAEETGFVISDVPETRDDLLARAEQATKARDDWPGPVRRAVLLLQGVQPWFHNGTEYEFDSAYPGIGLAARLKLVWLTFGCDQLMSPYGGPDWHELESHLQPDGQRWLSGEWNTRARVCAEEVADVIEDIGIGATGPEGDLVADLLIHAPFTTQPRLSYLRAQRALDHKLAHKWSEPDPDGVRLRQQGIGDLYAAATAGHPQAMARIGRHALAGEMSAAMEDMSASDERVAAFVFLSLALEAGEDTQEDVTAVADLLSDDERKSADEILENWRNELADVVTLLY